MPSPPRSSARCVAGTSSPRTSTRARRSSFRCRAAPATLEGHVRALASLDPPRNAAHPQSLERVAAYIESELRAAGGAVRAQEFDVDGLRWTGPRADFADWTKRLGATALHERASALAARVAVEARERR